MQAFRRQHVGLDQVVQRLQRRGARAHLVGQGRGAEIDALSRVAIALTVQRLMRPILLEEDRRQQVGAGPAARRRMEGRRRLRDPLAIAARELLADRLDHLPAARDHLERLGHVLADLRQPLRATARAGHRTRHHHPLARKMLGEGLARRLAADEPLHLGGLDRRPLGRQLVLGGTRRELVERKLKLIEKTLAALGAPTVERPTQLLDHQRQRGDLRLGRRRPRLRRRKRCLQRVNVQVAPYAYGAGSESDSLAHGNC